jgi:all-trans-retinol dehydrogenase (NAD+)
MPSTRTQDLSSVVAMSVALRRVLDLLTSAISQAALNPFVTAALIWILTKGPEQLRSQLTSRIAALRNPRRYTQIVNALKWCLAFGTAGVINKQLNHIALNAGRLRSEKARWNWSQEVAVITGGCSGIGELVVKRLVSNGIKVAILDIQQLPPSLQGRRKSFHMIRPSPKTNVVC